MFASRLHDIVPNGIFGPKHNELMISCRLHNTNRHLSIVCYYTFVARFPSPACVRMQSISVELGCGFRLTDTRHTALGIDRHTKKKRPRSRARCKNKTVAARTQGFRRVCHQTTETYKPAGNRKWAYGLYLILRAAAIECNALGACEWKML